MKKDIKEKIPNILTIIRICFTPFIILFGLLGYIKIVILLSIICAVTDLLDGKLARAWNVTSLKGAKLDAVADKVFAIGLTACLIRKFHLLIILLVLEIILAITNLYYHYKTNRTESLIIGKFKITFLFITMIVAIISTFSNMLTPIMNGLCYTTINLQILSIISYFKKHYEVTHQKNLSVEQNPVHQKIMNTEENNDIEETIVIDDLIELAKKYNTYSNEKDDIY